MEALEFATGTERHPKKGKINHPHNRLENDAKRRKRERRRTFVRGEGAWELGEEGFHGEAGRKGNS